MTKDFSHQDLRGRSFKNQDLTGADFSHADIRGTNFKGAILKGANFTNAKGGLTKKSYALYLLMILVLSALAGFLLALSGYGIAFFISTALILFNLKSANSLLYTFTIVYALISVFFIHRGNYKFWNISLITILFVVGSVVSAIALTLILGESDYLTENFKGASSVFMTLTVGFGALLISAIAVVIVSFGVISLSGIIAAVGFNTLGITIAIVISVSIAISVISILVGGNEVNFENLFSAKGGGGAIIIYLILSIYIAYRTSKEDSQFEIFRKFGISISSLFGTNFDSANLTEANFSEASLKYSRFSKETITLRTCFQDAENLKFARLTKTILENKAVRELLATGNGKNQSYAGMNLKGAYLVGADLQGADFHEADLIGATLENANLKDANLSRIQALGVEFRGADFTGACLDAWNIDTTTQLDGANADYVYLLGNKLERRPASGNFGQGEFAKLFNEVLDTVDFIFRNGIDWQAFMVSFDNLREKIRVESDNAEISIQGIANKGDGVFVVKVNVPLDADKAEIHSDFRKEYDTQLKLIEERYKAQLEAKDDVISVYREQNINLLDIIKYQAQRPLAVRNIRTEIHGNVNNSKVISGDENEVSG